MEKPNVSDPIKIISKRYKIAITTIIVLTVVAVITGIAVTVIVTQLSKNLRINFIDYIFKYKIRFKRKNSFTRFCL